MKVISVAHKVNFFVPNPINFEELFPYEAPIIDHDAPIIDRGILALIDTYRFFMVNK